MERHDLGDGMFLEIDGDERRVIKGANTIRFGPREWERFMRRLRKAEPGKLAFMGVMTPEEESDDENSLVIPKADQ